MKYEIFETAVNLAPNCTIVRLEKDGALDYLEVYNKYNGRIAQEHTYSASDDEEFKKFPFYKRIYVEQSALTLFKYLAGLANIHLEADEDMFDVLDYDLDYGE